MIPPPPSSNAVSGTLDDARRVLTERFGFNSFREGQEQVIEAALSGRDLLVVMPTGGGKSLCYQLPACVSDGVTLVISPLIALMKDQVDALVATGIPAAAINSSLDFETVRTTMERVRAGEIKLLYVAPERFDSRFFMNGMAGIKVAQVAVDEAHCISQWGHDFRPAYLRLTRSIEALGRPPLIALTATATPLVQDDIANILGLKNPLRLVTGFERENLHLAVHAAGKKKDALSRFVKQHPGPGIVYCATRRKVDDACSQLLADGHRAVAYHAGLQDNVRMAAQDAFIDGDVPIIVATNAFGMGVDKPDVRFVLHYDMPGTIEAYYQEAGRAGRDGKPSDCALLYGGGDRFTQEFFINASYPTEAFVLELWDTLVNAANDYVVEVSHRELLNRMSQDGSEMGVSSALKLLEGEKALTRLNARTNPAIIRVVDRGKVGERAQVQQRLLSALDFHLPEGGRGTVYVPIGVLADDAGIDHEAALRGIHAMQDAGAIEFTPPFRGRGIRLLEDELPEVDFSTLEAKRRFAFAALDAMEGYCRTPGCRQAAILAHFGETGKNCNACDRCLNTGGTVGTPVENTELARKLLSGVARCRLRTGDGFISFGINTVAGHLTGANTEQIRRNKLDQVSTYGLLKALKQKQVSDLLGELLAQGMLSRENMGNGPARRPVLAITETGLAVLKGERDGVLLTPPQAVERAVGNGTSANKKARSAADTDLPPIDDALFIALKGLRTRLAEAADKPAFMIFADRTLNEMAALKPISETAMLEVSGVGPTKMERFGEDFLNVIREHQADQQSSPQAPPLEQTS